MQYLGLIALLLLTGCASTFDAPPPRPERLQSNINFQIVPDSMLPPGVGGQARWNGDDCTVWIRASLYPRCVTHEIRHCIEGHFHHPQVASGQDCSVD